MEPKPDCEAYMFGIQNSLQTVLLLVAVLMIPIMLFGKPVYGLITKRKPRKVRKNKK